MSTAEERLSQWRGDHDKAFEFGAWVALNLWDTLMICVDQGWGGGNPESKLGDLYSDVMTLFEVSAEKGVRVYPEMVEPILSSCILEDFNCEANDGSAAFTAKLLCVLRDDCTAGKFEGLEKLAVRLEKKAGKPIDIRRLPGDAESEDDDDVEGDDDDELEELREEDEEQADRRDGRDARTSAPSAAAATAKARPGAEESSMAAEDDGWEVVTGRGHRSKGAGAPAAGASQKKKAPAKTDKGLSADAGRDSTEDVVRALADANIGGDTDGNGGPRKKGKGKKK